ncbi:MAG: hypothetical protein GY941_26235 [Planctomycetes bacterium]|nr:hypothetical protein [Planctomycetota bacterium]
MWKILRDEIVGSEFLNFTVENISVLFGYIATGRINIRFHSGITDKMWFGAGKK